MDPHVYVVVGAAMLLRYAGLWMKRNNSFSAENEWRIIVRPKTSIAIEGSTLLPIPIGAVEEIVVGCARSPGEVDELRQRWSALGYPADRISHEPAKAPMTDCLA